MLYLQQLNISTNPAKQTNRKIQHETYNNLSTLTYHLATRDFTQL